ncbi:MAG: 2,3,4,5-tetrahydropyridine-2,6-dicarboxylate N-succinyltransferase, partial [Pseudomonadota bacterium]|nr:2,3,4,5-tetrahydropyridine-2,6-dicarboxylate N-succinyltransferase [Pseudomonadota bacterium]
MREIAEAIEAAFKVRADLKNTGPTPEARSAVSTAIAMLDTGEERVAEPTSSGWIVNEWLKKAVLLSFLFNENSVLTSGDTKYFDKVPGKFDNFDRSAFQAGGYRVVPPAMVRRGAYLGPNVILMPSYVNIGAYVGSGTMVDTWATVGSCAQ